MAKNVKADAAIVPCGLCINLKKDILGGRTEGRNYVLGYFDRIDIRQVEKWLEYSPRNSAPQGMSMGSKQEWPISSYPIKLLFPAVQMIQDLEKLGLDYMAWRTSQPASVNTFNQFFDEYPCITAILINLTDEFKGDLPRDVCGDQLRRLADIICQGNQETGTTYSADDLKNAHLCIMPSLGYSDYCILLAEREWSISLSLMQNLRRAVGREGHPVLSTDYIIPIYHTNQRREPFINPSKQLKLSVLVNLKPGVPMEHLREVMKGSARVYQVSGSADCLLVSNDPQKMSKILLELIGHDRGQNDGILNMAMNTEAALWRPIEGGHSPGCRVLYPSILLNDAIRDIRVALEAYEKLLRCGCRHMRQLSAMHERVTLIENICGECHNRSLQLIMREWLPAFTACLNKCIGQIQAKSQALEVADDALRPRLERDLGIFWEKTETALECFIDQVGSFISDLSRSDCFFLETERCNHPSVSSATALLVAYNRWQNNFVRDVVAEDQSDEQNGRLTYPFLVRSGGCDSTHTRNLFDFLEPEVAEDGLHIRENLPLISQMSEMSLFDCSGAVFRMTHECMHYCGKRFRRERVLYIFDFIAQYYGRVLAGVLLDSDVYLHQQEALLKGIYFIESPALSAAMEKVWHEASALFAQDISFELKKALMDLLEKESGKWDETNYMSVPLNMWMRHCLSVMFSGFDFTSPTRYFADSLVRFLYLRQQQAAIDLFAQYDEIVHKDRPNFNAFKLESQKIRRHNERDLSNLSDKQRLNSSIKVTDPTLERMIIYVLNQFLISAAYSAGERDPVVKCRRSGVIPVLGIVFEYFSEGFADLQACLRLNASLEDYLLSFAFENWDVDAALPLDERKLFRISALLRVQFGQMLTSPGKDALTEEARDNLINAARQLRIHGIPPGRINGALLANRVDALLKQYALFPAEGAALENYLRLCQEKYNAEAHDAMDSYSRAFQCLRLSSQNCAIVDKAAQIFTSLTMVGEV